MTSGAHIYNFTDDIIYAYGKMVAIHAASDGEKRIFLPEKSAVTDAYSGEHMQPCDYFFDFTMKKGETRVFVTETEGAYAVCGRETGCPEVAKRREGSE